MRSVSEVLLRRPSYCLPRRVAQYMDDQVYHHLDDLIDVIDMELWFDGLIEDKRNLSND